MKAILKENGISACYFDKFIDDIQEHFECSRRSAERMKTLLFEMFADKVEEVPTNDHKKRWRFAKGTMNALITFTSDDFANLEQLKGLVNDENRKKFLDEIILLPFIQPLCNNICVGIINLHSVILHYFRKICLQ